MAPLPAKSTRATRGHEPYRQQPKLRFRVAVPAKIFDHGRLAKAENIGNGEQGYLGPVIAGRVPYLTTSSRADFLSAFNKRVNYRDPSRVDPSIRALSRSLIKKLVPKQLPTISWDSDLYRSWLEQFDSEKRARMEHAYKTQGLEQLNDYSRKELFTKIEALVKDPETVAPRIIFKGTDYYNMIAGPIFQELMVRFKSTESQSLPQFKFMIAYKQHAPEIVEFLEQKKSRSWIESDFSSNDKTQVKDVMELELVFMRRLGCPKWFLDLHRASNKFSVYNSKHGVSAVAENQLPTGAVDTTFRNSFWNLCIFYCWSRKYNVTGSLLAVLGDDMLAGLERRVRRGAHHYEQTAALAKMQAKCTMFRTLHNCHFLSKHFVPVMRGENAHVMLPFIGKIISKFNARPNANQAVSDDEYMAGKSLSHCYEFRYCHVIRDLFVERANYHLRRTGGKFSMEGITWHVRVHSAYKGEIEKLLAGATQHRDLVTKEDLSLFWQTLGDVTFTDVFPTVKRVVLGVTYELLDHVAINCLRDY